MKVFLGSVVGAVAENCLVPVHRFKIPTKAFYF